MSTPKITITASLPYSGAWFTPKKDGSGIVRFEFSASEFPEVMKLSKYMDPFTKSGVGATFRLTVEDDPNA